ncbi:hypothetical protein NK553_18600 [Pseudomonas sp. ZM23]|jgi:hypothetical protein|nr:MULTISPECIES: prenyltransferase/squalene oxidase repeat-containing protein [Pseudomonadota]MCP8465965.1 hypothetical protein [Pseudomonas triclosanedens]MCP8477264.1 hypothetical protein [Pseudomonas triclosanedens]WAI47398.1 hypothetical protein OU419_16615 [Pseudomonas triclosanedens]
MPLDSPSAFNLVPSIETRLKSAVHLARNYILERASPGGGFCFYRGYHLEEPNLSDTWHSTRAWTLLTNALLPERAKHIDFVLSQGIGSQPFALYHRVRSLQELQAEDPDAPRVREAVASLPLTLPHASAPTLQASLHALFYSLWLRQHFGLPMAGGHSLGQELQAMENVEGGFGRPSNLHDTVEALRVLEVCGCGVEEKTANFVRRVAVAGFGFRLTETSLSPCLETTCAGIACSISLGIPIDYALDAIDFILACQTGHGGFAFRPGGLPDLAWTHLALETIYDWLNAQAAP